MGDLWRMTVADRRWWIAQTIDFIQQQNEAQKKAAGKGGPSQRPRSTQQDPEAVKAAREMLQNYHQFSSSNE